MINRPEEGGRGGCLLRSLDTLEAPRQLLLKAAADHSRWGEGTARFLTYREQQAAIQVEQLSGLQIITSLRWERLRPSCPEGVPRTREVSGRGNLSRLGKQVKVPGFRTPDRALRDVRMETGFGEWAQGPKAGVCERRSELIAQQPLNR
ncbi:hypothetical protein LEMLEM_LOCUS968 [Lemmus lemmus]